MKVLSDAVPHEVTRPPEHPEGPACNREDQNPDDWFPTSSAGFLHVQDICLNKCPVRKQCLEYVVPMTPQPPGVWAGLSVSSRYTLKRSMQERGMLPDG